jgi:hypothetical protein
MKEFSRENEAFVKGCSGLLLKFKASLGLLTKKTRFFKGIERRLNFEAMSEKGKRGERIYVDPVYSTNQDPREVVYYEDVMGPEAEDLSINLIWTENNGIFFKRFKVQAQDLPAFFSPWDFWTFF